MSDFIKNIPELSGISEADKKNLISIISLGQLITSLKVIEENLGLQGTIANLLFLPEFAKVVNPTQVVNQASSEQKLELSTLNTGLVDYFIAKGLKDNQAQLLASTVVEIAKGGLTTPNLTANITSDTVNLPLLEKSIASGLVLNNNYSAELAQNISQEAINATLSEGPLSSTQFRNLLERSLRDLQVSNSSQIAQNAIFIPVNDPLLAARDPLILASNKPQVDEGIGLPSVGAEPIIKETPLTEQSQPSPPSLDELRSIAEKRINDLITPQLGNKIGHEVTEVIIDSVFGGRTAQESAQPTSLVNEISHQIDNIKVDKEEKFNEKMSDSHKEWVKRLTDSFATTLTEPMVQFLRQAPIGQGEKRGVNTQIDIPI